MELPRIAPFAPELTRVTSRYSLKVTAGPPRPADHTFVRTALRPHDLGALIPLGPTYNQALMRPQVLQYLLSLAQADPAVVPPWTGEIQILFHASRRELVMSGQVETAFLEDNAQLRLSEYCQAVVNLLVAFAQMPGTPTFEVIMEGVGTWEARH